MKRTKQIKEAAEILLKYKDKDTPVGIVRNIKRDGETKTITTLDKMTGEQIDMLSTIIIGSSRTYVSGSKMITPRGYKI